MNRQSVTREQLKSIINEEFSKIPDVEGVHISGVSPLAGTDAEGCNWSTANIGCSLGNSTEEILDPIVSKIVHDINCKYNLKPK
jgi:hypothetical protein